MRSYSWPENHWNWPIPLTHQHGVRHGNLVFTGGQASLNSRGEVVHPGSLAPQCEKVIEFVNSILDDLGATMGDVVRWVVYFVGDSSDEERIATLLREATPDCCQPTISTVCLPALCYEGMRIELEAVAWCPTQGSGSTAGSSSGDFHANDCHSNDFHANTRQFVRDESLSALAKGFSHAVRCGNLIFTSDCSALDASGTVQSPDDLVLQTRLMMDSLTQTLACVGATMDDVLKLNVFYRGDGTAASWSEPARIRAEYFSEPGPAATGIAVNGFAHPDLKTKIAVTAGVDSGDACKYAWPDNHWDWTEKLPYKHGNRFEKLIHLGGQVALDHNGAVLHPDDMVEQTRIAMQNIKSVLAELGATLDDVVKVTTFYQGGASAEALHKNLLIRSGSYQIPGPATSGIPVPHLVYESMVIEIEVIAIIS